MGISVPYPNNGFAGADSQAEQVVCKSDLAEGVILNLIYQVDVDALSICVVDQVHHIGVACVNRVAEVGINRGEKSAAGCRLEESAIHVSIFNAVREGDDDLIGGDYSWRGLNWLIDPGDGLLVIIVASCHAGNKESKG